MSDIRLTRKQGVNERGVQPHEEELEVPVVVYNNCDTSTLSATSIISGNVDLEHSPPSYDGYLTDTSVDSLCYYMNHLSHRNSMDKLYPYENYVLLIRKEGAYMQRKEDNSIYPLADSDLLCGNELHMITDMLNSQYEHGGTTIYHYYDVIVGNLDKWGSGYKIDNPNIGIKMPSHGRKTPRIRGRKKQKKEARKKIKISSLHTDDISYCAKARRDQFVPNSENLYIIDNQSYTHEEFVFIKSMIGSKFTPQAVEDEFNMTMGSKFDSAQLSRFVSTMSDKLTSDNAQVFGLLEGFLLAVISVFDSKTFIGQCAAIAQFIRPYLNDSGSALVYVKECFSSCFEDQDILYEHSESTIGDFEPMSNIFTKVKEFRDLPVFRHCCTAASLLVGIGFIKQSNFTKDCAKKFSAAVIPKQSESKDFFSCVLDTLDFFFDRGYACFVTRSLDPFLNVNDEHTIFQEKLAFLKANIVEVRCGNFEDIHKDRVPCLTLGDFVDTIEYCKNYVKTNMATAQPGWKSTLAGYLGTIEKIHNEYFIHASSSSMRVAPFCVKIFGGSGVCKSSLYRYTINSVLTYNNYDASDDRIVNLDPDDKFEPNMRSNTNAVVFDDMANTSSAFLTMAPTSKLIKIVNNAPAYANMPEAEMKGRVLMNPKLVVITTNIEDLCAGTYSNEPFSLLRRCHVHVRVKLRPSLLDRSGKLDQKLLEAFEESSNSTYENMWLITMKTVREIEPTLGKKSASQYTFDNLSMPGVNEGKPLVDIDIFTYLKVCNLLSAEHYRVQGLIVKKQANLASKAIHCQCRGPVDGTGTCIMCGSKSKLILGLSPQSGLFTNMITLGSRAVDTNYYQNVIANTCYDFTVGLMSDIADVFTFSRLDQYVSRVVGSMSNGSTLSSMDVALFYSSPLVRLVSYCTPLSIKQDPAYFNFMRFATRKHAYRRVRLGLYVNVALGCLVGCTPRVLSTRFRDNTLKFGVFGVLSSMWNVWWCHAVKNSMDRAISHDIATTTKLIRAEEDWVLQGHSPKPSTVLRWATFGMLGVGSIRIVIGMISQAYNTYYDLIETEVEEKENKPNSAITNVSENDIQLRDNMTNVWQNVSTKFNADTMTPLQFLNKIAGGTLTMQIFVDNKPGVFIRTSAIMLKQGCVLYPRHNWFSDKKVEIPRSDSMKVKFGRTDMTRGVGGSHWIETIYWATSYRIPGTDLMISMLKLGGPFLDITSLFHDDECRQNLFVSQGRDKEGKISIRRGAMSVYGTQPVDYYPDVTCRYYKCEFATESWKDGDCGTVIVNDGPKPRICGFHLLGSVDRPHLGLSVVVKNSMIMHAIEEFDRVLGALHIFLPNALVETPKRIGDLDYNIEPFIHPCSPVNNIPEDHSFNVLGTINNTNSYKSEYRLSKLAGYMTDVMGIPNIWRTPAFKSVGDWDPWQVICNKISSPSASMDPVLLHKATCDYCGGFKFNDQDLSYLKPLTNMEILCGVDGKRFIDAMKLQTSCGYPMKGKKDRYIVPVDCTTHARGLDFIPEQQKMWTFLDLLEKDYDQGIKKGYIFSTCLKDEVVSKQKARGFYCAPLLLAMHMRKYGTPILRLMCMNPIVTECAVGINPFSLEWQEVHNYLTAFGNDQIVAGDHQSWDLRQSAALMMAGGYCMERMAAFGNYSDYDLKQLRAGHSEIIYPIIDINGTVVQPFGMMTSGHNATANWNSINNSLCLRMVFHHYYPDYDFREYVHLITYGDDFVCGVSPLCPNFNFNTIQAFLLKHCDMVLTSFDKKMNAPNYANIFEVEFLKRRSVLLGDTGYYVGALDTNSIYKSLMWTRARKSEENNVIIDTVTSQLHEFFYHGEKQYDDFVSHMKVLLAQLGLTLPGLSVSWHDRLLLWKEKHMGLVLDDDSTPKTLAKAREFLNQNVDCLGGTSQLPCLDKQEVWILHNLLDNIIYEDSNPTCKEEGSVMCAGNTSMNGIAATNSLENYAVQSGLDTGVIEDNTSNTLMEFQIRDGAFTNGMDFHQDETFDTLASEGSQIGDFFHRPLKIYDVDWESLNGPSIDLDLVREYFSNKRVVNRVNNYAYITGTMCVRIACNGSPYHFGKAMVGINYWPAMDTSLSAVSVTQLSQLPHIDINPTLGTVGCLEIPLFHPYNAISLVDYDRVVDLSFRTINALLIAGDNPTDAPPITISVWCWMKDYKLLSPTSVSSSNLVPQSDEYEERPVSRAATVTANNLGILSKLPYVGRYARISQLAVSVVGELASTLGFSRPLAINDEVRQAPRIIGNLSNVNYSDCSTKLSLDIKQEVTIDSMVTGYKEDNDMLLINVAKRESLIYSTIWNTSIDFLPCVVVNPLVAPSAQNVDDIAVVNSTPMSYVSIPFNFWRGNIKFRVEVVGSAFHRGKLRIVYDPLNPESNSWVTDSNINYSYIMDIAKEREYTMDVGWATNKPFLNTGSPKRDFITESSEFGALDYQASTDNGVLLLYVEHPLRSVVNDPSPQVYINIYISAGDDFQLCEPTDKWMSQFTNNVGELVPQSIEETPGVGQAPIPEMMPSFNINKNMASSYSTSDKYDITFFGERVSSIRQLVKRYCSNRSIRISLTGAVNMNSVWLNRNDFPNYSGPSNTGLDESSANGKYTYACNSNFLNWYTPMFLMRRGGVRNKYVLSTDTPNKFLDFSASRSEGPGTSTSVYSLDVDGNEVWFLNYRQEQAVLNGSQITLPQYNPVLEIDCPYYTSKRFYFAQDRDKETNFGDGDIRRECGHRVTINTKDNDANGILRRYTAAADDYSLYMFKYAPILMEYRAGPPFS